jgi:hypothetical protein
MALHLLIPLRGLCRKTDFVILEFNAIIIPEIDYSRISRIVNVNHSKNYSNWAGHEMDDAGGSRK